MSYISVRKKIKHPELKKNKLGLTIRDYDGVPSTLCGGCGHDSISAAISQAVFELALPPHRIMKFSGIGCSSKTPAYFLGAAHGFNGVHGRMPALATGAHAALRELPIIGISGDGDSLSIGMGQLVHAIRRQVQMSYIIANNGVFGLTKGQFSASADKGSLLKDGTLNPYHSIDPVLLAIMLGASFVARSFSADKEELVPLIKMSLQHKGFALLDVISPCVAFNNHKESTKSYNYVRSHSIKQITLNDGTQVALQNKDPQLYKLNDPEAAYHAVASHHKRGIILTGLLFQSDHLSMHEALGTREEPSLAHLPYESLNLNSERLKTILKAYK